MSQTDTGNTGSDDRLAVALARGLSREKAGRVSGVSRSTVQRRLRDPAFVARVAEVRREMNQRTLALLVGSSCQAVLTLRKLLEAESETARLGAARAILDNVVRVREVQELSDRLERIERILETPQGEKAEVHYEYEIHATQA